MIVPILAPAIGTAIMAVADWRWVFGSLGLFSAIIFVWTQLRLPMTLAEEDRRPFSFEQVSGAFKMIASHRITAGGNGECRLRVCDDYALQFTGISGGG